MRKGQIIVGEGDAGIEEREWGWMRKMSKGAIIYSKDRGRFSVDWEKVLSPARGRHHALKFLCSKERSKKQ